MVKKIWSGGKRELTEFDVTGAYDCKDVACPRKIHVLLIFVKVGYSNRIL